MEFGVPSVCWYRPYAIMMAQGTAYVVGTSHACLSMAAAGTQQLEKYRSTASSMDERGTYNIMNGMNSNKRNEWVC
jgi:hypothetical protein